MRIMDLATSHNNNNNGALEGNCFEMDEDTICSQEQMDATETGETDNKTGIAEETETIDEANSPKGCVLKMLDEMDRRVEKLRADTIKVEAERDDILATLDTLNNSQLVHNLNGVELDEICRYIKRLAQRSAAVKVEISSERSIQQQESLHAVNTLIDGLIREVQTDVAMARRRCISYLNSCSDVSDDMFQESCGIDSTFEEAVLGCTLEDQKRVKKRLSGLYSYFSTFSPPHSQLTEIKEEEDENENAPRSSSSLS